MLGAVVFVAGAILMALEMVGSRVLAPYFGTSIYVWGSLISVVLLSLTTGYFAGGRLADRMPTAEAMGWLIVAPGAFVSLLPLWADSLNAALAQSGVDVRTGSLVSALLLFFVPGLFLGTVSPYAVRLAARRVETIGFTAGSLYAISTAGSIAGTLLTAFYLIAWLGVRQILYLLGASLTVLGLGVVAWGVAARGQPSQAAAGPLPSGRLSRPAGGSGLVLRGGQGRRAWWRVVWALIAVGVAAVSWWAGGGARSWAGAAGGYGAVRLVKDSAYHHILVVDEPTGIRLLRFDASWQSAMDLADPERLVFLYTRYFHLAMALVPEAREALFVGLGGGSVPKNFLGRYPLLRIDVAEIDPEVIEVARRHFAVPEDPRLAIYAQDGRSFLAQTRRLYDVIFLDAYFADSIPFHLTTVEFVRAVRERLGSGGVVASNIIGALSGDKSRLFRSMLKTIRAVFPTVYVLPVGSQTGLAWDPVQRNILVLATDRPALSADEFYRVVAEAEQERRIPRGSALLARSLVRQPIDTSDVPLLTDDFAPVDTLIRL